MQNHDTRPFKHFQRPVRGGSIERMTTVLAAAASVLMLCLVAPAIGAVGTLADSSGEVVAWGSNLNGETTVPSGTFTAIGASAHTLGIKSDGTLAGWGANTNGQPIVPSGTFTAIEAGGLHSLGIKSDGTLAGWGYNDEGEAMVPSGTFTAIGAGRWHSLGIKSNGTLVGWGDNTYGQRTVPSGTFTAISAGDLHSLGIKSDGTLAGWGDNTYGQRTVPSGTFTAISAGGEHSVGIKSDGTLACWGWNGWGQAAVPSGTFTAISAGGEHSLAIRSDGTLMGWGNNADGRTTVPSGTFTAIEAGPLDSFGLRARTSYDGDLLVSGSGMNANLNRSINVAGNMTVETTTNFYNNPTVNIGGKLTLAPGAAFAGATAGTITANGLEVQTSFTLPSNFFIESSGPLAGAGTLNFNGGTLRVTGTNVVTNTLSLLAGGGTFDVPTASTTLTVTSAISGAGKLTKIGGATFALTGANTYTGGTTVGNGGLYIGNGGTTGSITGDVNLSAGTLGFNRSNAMTFANTISGAGGVLKAGSGTTTLTGNNTYTGGTHLIEGTLSLGSSSAIGATGPIYILGGTLQYSAGNSTDYSSRLEAYADCRIDTNGQNVTFASPLAAFAGLTKLGGGTLHLTGANTYTGGTTVGNGALYIGNGGTTGSITGDVNLSAGTLGFNRSNAMTFANTISGAGGVSHLGSGTTTVTGNNTYTGGTNLVGGTLSLGSSGAIGATGPIYILGGTLQYSANNTTDYSSRLEAYADCRIDTNGQNVTFASPLTVFAGLTKLGGGSLVLTNANTYSGDTSVNAGRLLVINTSGSGTGSGAVAVNVGGTLGGTGSISGVVTVNSGGHIAPGASIESLDVGSLVLNAGSILDFELGAPGSPGINSDLINVTASGGLTLSGGAVALTNAGGLAVGTYKLIDYAGTQGGAVANLGTPTGPAGFSYTLVNNTSNTSVDLFVSILGDYSHNNVVDAADYALWRKSPNSYGGNPAGYNTWRAHFGQTGGSGASAPASAAVPEPASVWLLILGTVVASWRGRRIASRVPLSL